MADILETPVSKPFPYWPPTPTLEMQKRSELMMDLNKWSNNDEGIAKDIAAALVKVLEEQFGL